MGVMNRLMYNCSEATFMISKSRHKKLTFSEKQKLKMHLAMCKHCRSFSKEIALLEKNIAMVSNTSILEKAFYKLPETKKSEIRKMINNS